MYADRTILEHIILPMPEVIEKLINLADDNSEIIVAVKNALLKILRNNNAYVEISRNRSTAGSLDKSGFHHSGIIDIQYGDLKALESCKGIVATSVAGPEGIMLYNLKELDANLDKAFKSATSVIFQEINKLAEIVKVGQNTDLLEIMKAIYPTGTFMLVRISGWVIPNVMDDFADIDELDDELYSGLKEQINAFRKTIK